MNHFVIPNDFKFVSFAIQEPLKSVWEELTNVFLN